MARGGDLNPFDNSVGGPKRVGRAPRLVSQWSIPRPDAQTTMPHKKGAIPEDCLGGESGDPSGDGGWGDRRGEAMGGVELGDRGWGYCP